MGVPTARKRAPRKTQPPAVTLAAGAGVPEPTGMWAKALEDAQRTLGLAIPPFEVHAGLTLYPPTPARNKKKGNAQFAYMAAVRAIANAVANGATQDEVYAIIKERDEAEQAYNEALYGTDEFALVEAYFEDQPAWRKEVFVRAVKKQFERLPDDGVCPICGHTDEDEAGKDEESSTSSNTTGQNLTPTSPTT